MSKPFKTFVFVCVLGAFFLSGALAQDHLLSIEKRATGAIPLTAEQFEKVLTTWPRVDRVNFNRIGRERINRVKALKGETLLPLSEIKAIGRETESSIHPAGTPDMPIVLNEDLTGALPVYVDNSTDTLTGLHFPPIRDQGSFGSCAAWASTYYQLSYMTALQRGWDIRNPEDNTNKYSPKWSYNLLNGGANSGSSIENILTLLEQHGAVTWAEFPYDTDYLAWCLNTNAWRNALSVRTEPAQFSWHTETNAGLEVIKQLLANGYVLTFNTDIYAWHLTLIPDNPSTTDDTPAVGKAIGYWVDTTASGHSMTIVGYNDSIWTDINGNSTMDAGELGALRIANSWGPAWHPAGAPEDGGFIWLAYDALKGVSAVPSGPSTGREAAFWNNLAYVQTARENYSPSLITEFTVNHAKRNQLTLSLGTSATTATTPSTIWTPIAFSQQGGAYAFDGTTTACDGTFVLDFSNILPSTGDLRRFYLRMADSTSGDTATLSAFKIIDYTTDPDTEVVCALVPQYADASTVNPYVEHTYTGPTYNNPPYVNSGRVNPVAGTNLDTYYFVVWYYDVDGHVPTVKYVYIDGTPYALTYYSGGSYSASHGWYRYVTTLGVGNHNFRFYMEDGYGGSGQDPITLAPPEYFTYEGPAVVLAHFVTTPSTPTGELSPNLRQSYTYSTSGSTCYQGHSIQYQFDWGDGTTSDWLAVGVTSAQHTWNSSGVFGVKAQARCAENNAILSSSSSSVLVSAAIAPLLSQSFPGSTFPTGWTQQVVGTTNRWSVVNSANAGGQAYEMRYTISSVTGVARLVTPAIDTTGRSALFLNFKHFMDAFTGGGAWVKIQTSPDGTNWTDEAWVVPVVGTTNIGPETVFTTVTHNLNITTTYVAFTVEGNLGAVFYWYVDDVFIGAATPPKPKVDFNNDGQEDILWRYQGPGGLQGSNVIWLMNQTEGLASIPLGISAQETGSMNLPEGSAPRFSRGTPLDAGKRLISKSGKSSLSPLGRGKLPVPKLGKSSLSPIRVEDLPMLSKRSAKRSPMESDRNFANRTATLFSVPTMKDAETISAADDGRIGIASVGIGGYLYLPAISELGWEFAGAGDFNGDGNTDILWRNYGAGEYSGWNCVWYMNGATIIGYGYPEIVLDLDWRIEATGDFNGDGHTDILWRNYGSGTYSGWNCIWYMDGKVITGYGHGAVGIIDYGYPEIVLDRDWKIAGAGDFNGDGHTDILWRNYGSGTYSGWNCIWHMDGTMINQHYGHQQEGIIGFGYPCGISDLSWEIVGTGDFNKDGYTDILWRYYGPGGLQGWNCIWYMQGNVIVGYDYPATILDTNWRIVNR